MMRVYKLTAFAANGKTILDEAFEAAHDVEAKIKGENILKEKQLDTKTHRCVSPEGTLVLFQS